LLMPQSVKQRPVSHRLPSERERNRDLRIGSPFTRREAIGPLRVSVGHGGVEREPASIEAHPFIGSRVARLSARRARAALKVRVEIR